MNLRAGCASLRMVAIIIHFALALIFGFSQRLIAQAGQSEITGVVTDTAGSVMANVAITLTNTATGTKTATLPSNDAGLYYVRSLPPGIYDLDATRPGFRTFRATKLQVTTGQVLRYDIKMEVGDGITRVEVTEEAEMRRSRRSPVTSVRCSASGSSRTCRSCNAGPSTWSH